MRKNFGISLLALLLTGTLYVGCKEKPVTTPGDLENPVIVMSSPETVDLDNSMDIYSSDSFDVDIRFEDDFELRDYEITIRFNPDLSYLRTANDPWSETWHGSLSGKSQAINFRVFSVYNPTAGPYEFTVKVNDEAGKQTMLRTYFNVINKADSTAPRIRFTNPDSVLVDSFTIGQNMGIQALVTEQGANVVKNVYLRVRDHLTEELMPNSEIRWDTLYFGTIIVDTFVTIPAGTVPGNYDVELFANDPTNNVAFKSVMVYIKPN